MSLNLKAISRDIVGKKTKQLRKQGQIPAILYGHEVESQSITIRTISFEKIFAEAGQSSLVDLEIDGNTTPVLIHDAQFDPVRGTPLHADLFAVSMKEKLQTEIPLTFIGTSEAVELLEGTLVTNKVHLKVECLPLDLVHQIEVDLSVLKTFTDVIHIKDLTVSDKLTILDEKDEVVALVHAPKTEEELEAELAEPVGEEAPVEAELSVERGKEEEVEPTEGEAAPATEETPAGKEEK